MASESELQEAFERLFNKYLKGTVTTDAIITDVDSTAFTCTVEIGGVPFYNVAIEILKGSQASFMPLPVVGASCLVCFRDNKINQPQIIKVDQIDKLLINCQTDVEFNGGALGGMVKVTDLITQLNNLQKDINTLKQIFTAWVPSPSDGGAALKAAALTWAAQSLPLTNRNDIENTKIKQ